MKTQTSPLSVHILNSGWSLFTAGLSGSHGRTSEEDKYICRIATSKSIADAYVSGLKVSSLKVHRREPEKFLHSLPQLGVVWFVTIDMSLSRLLILRSRVYGHKSWSTGWPIRMCFML